MNKVIIIAEAGVNHNGDLNIAKQLIDKAAEAGADYVKFQTFKAKKLVTKSAEKAAYQKANINDGDNSQYNMLKKLEIPHEWHYELLDYAKEKGIAFISTGFDLDSVDFLDQLGIDLFKIPSGEVTNKPLLAHTARKGKTTILSTGMADIEEIRAAVDVMLDAGLNRENLTVLHCNTQYPTPFEDVNLHAMNHIKREVGVRVGYSDHTLGIEVPVAAVALGAQVIEKHFTLDKTLPGPDHLASLEPDELKAMVTAIRNIEQSVSGDGVKKTSVSEMPNKEIVRKSIYVGRSMQLGETITMNDLEFLRPADGISPMLIDDVLGKKLTKNLTEFTQIKFSDFE